ncbi:hypothetical protein REPUB_Repub06bG0188000 [Reevesia pubescens]
MRRLFYDPKSNTCAKGEMCGHYTQVLWKDTVRVGCARVKCCNGKGFYVIYNYDPPGNYINEHPFGNFANAGNLVNNSKPLMPKQSVVAPIPKPPFLPVLPTKKSLPVMPKPMQISG